MKRIVIALIILWFGVSCEHPNFNKSADIVIGGWTQSSYPQCAVCEDTVLTYEFGMAELQYDIYNSCPWEIRYYYIEFEVLVESPDYIPQYLYVYDEGTDLRRWQTDCNYLPIETYGQRILEINIANYHLE